MSAKKKNLFIRFNEIPENGRSFIYDENNIVCGAREGVSVYDAAKVDGKYTPVLPPQASKETRDEFFKYTIYNTSENYKKMYLVSGDLVARDERHCPIITNIEILDELDFDTEFPDRRPVEEATIKEETIEPEFEEVVEDPQPKENRIDAFVETAAETVVQVKDVLADSVKEATTGVSDFVEEVKTSKIYTETAGKVNSTAKKISRFAKAMSAFAKAFSEDEE